MLIRSEKVNKNMLTDVNNIWYNKVSKLRGDKAMLRVTNFLMDDVLRERVHQEAVHWEWGRLEFLLCYLDNAREDLIIG